MLATNYNRQMSCSVYIAVRANVYTRLFCRFVPTGAAAAASAVGWMADWLLFQQRTFVRYALSFMRTLHLHDSELFFHVKSARAPGPLDLKTE